jgi:hypothetical protein
MKNLVYPFFILPIEPLPRADGGELTGEHSFHYLYHSQMLSVIITILLETALEAILFGYFFFGLRKACRKRD